MCDYREIHDGWVADVRKKIFFIETTIHRKKEIIRVDRKKIDPHNKFRDLKANDPIGVKVTKINGEWVVKEIIANKPVTVERRKEKYRNGIQLAAAMG